MGKLDYGWGMRSITPRSNLFKIDVYKPSKEASLRLKWMLYYEEKKNASLTFRHFGISEKTFWKWYKRYKKDGVKGLENQSNRPLHVRVRTTPPEIVKAILDIRGKHPEWSKYKIHAALKDLYDLQTSVSSVGRILKDKGLILPRETKRRRKAAKTPLNRVSHALKRTVTYPGAIIHIDTKHLWQYGCGKMYHFTAVDAYSKFKHARAYSSISSRSARKFFEEVEVMFPFQIKAVITDNGSEYKGEFDTYLKTRNITHYFTHPYTPKQNAIAERAIRTDIEEFYHNDGLKFTVKEQNIALDEWNHFYNHERYHRSLNCLTPIQFIDKFNQLNPYPSTEP